MWYYKSREYKLNNQFYLISNHSTSSYSRDNYVDFQPLTLSIGEYLSIKSLILTDAIAEYSKDWSTPIYLQLFAVDNYTMSHFD